MCYYQARMRIAHWYLKLYLLYILGILGTACFSRETRHQHQRRREVQSQLLLLRGTLRHQDQRWTPNVIIFPMFMARFGPDYSYFFFLFFPRPVYYLRPSVSLPP
ncbi:unnamed protein product [Laminaria digitata]